MSEDIPHRQIKGHCPQCNGDRFADVVAFFRNFVEDDMVWVSTDHRVLQCAGCKTVYYQKEVTFSEEYSVLDNGEAEYSKTVSYFPAPSKREQPRWITPWDLHDDLYSLLNETYSALDIDARTLAGIGIRTVVDKASEIIGIDPAITFDEKLSGLFDKGKIGLEEKQHLEVLTDAGGAAAHRGWKPSVKELRALMDIMEAFLYRTFVLTTEFAELKQRIPPRPKRLPKADA